MNSETEIKNPETSHQKLATIRDSLLALHKQTSVSDFETNPTERKNLLDEVMAICAEESAILKSLAVA